MNRSSIWILILTAIGILCIAIGVYSLLKSDQGSVPVVSSNTSQRIVYSGNHEGVSLGVLQPNQTAILACQSGKIISNTQTGWSSPIWVVAPDKTQSFSTKRLKKKTASISSSISIRRNGESITIPSAIQFALPRN